MKQLNNPLIITRHLGLVEVLKEDFGIEGEVAEHATEELVRGRDVIGILPIYLASYANTITCLTIDVPPHLRGVELTSKQLREYMGELATYKVEKLG